MACRAINLGIIGLSCGNGHPYSWSAIFNGYNQEYMKDCSFPVIPQYLGKQSFPEDAISGARVTCVWTQDPDLSRHISKASNIDNVVDDYHDFIGQVDAVLLARDDCKNHIHFARPFLEAGLPVYIDKPIALSQASLDELFFLQRYEGQIFSCSAYRYSPDVPCYKQIEKKIGKIKIVHSYIAKDWRHYAIHLIDPILSCFSLYNQQCQVKNVSSGDVHTAIVEWENGLLTTISTLGSCNIAPKILCIGENGVETIEFSSTFYAFKRTLEMFLHGILAKETITKYSELSKAVYILEQGNVF